MKKLWNLHGKDLCPAAGRQCHKCKMMNHFARMCRNSGGQKKQVNTVDDHDSDYETVYWCSQWGRPRLG